MQAIEEAVKGANLIYLTARGHVVVVSEAEYPVVQGAEAAGGAAETVVCELWERCWCVLEMVVRYLAEQQVCLNSLRVVRCVLNHCGTSSS